VWEAAFDFPTYRTAVAPINTLCSCRSSPVTAADASASQSNAIKSGCVNLAGTARTQDSKKYTTRESHQNPGAH